MCGRYFLADKDSDEELQQIIEILNRRSPDVSPALKTAGEIFPNDTVPVIANTRSLQPAPFAMQWGYSVPDGKRIINARSETAAQKSFFRDGMLQRRCLVPASYYFEWKKSGKERTKYAISSESGAILYLAGIYRFENGRPVFTILTREPSQSVASIHDRMPVILPKSLLGSWLDLRIEAQPLLDQAMTNVLPCAVQ